MGMDTIRRLCEGQDSETRRRILAAYYHGAAAALKAGSKRPETMPALLRNQAE